MQSYRDVILSTLPALWSWSLSEKSCVREKVRFTSVQDVDAIWNAVSYLKEKMISHWKIIKSFWNSKLRCSVLPFEFQMSPTDSFSWLLCPQLVMLFGRFWKLQEFGLVRGYRSLGVPFWKVIHVPLSLLRFLSPVRWSLSSSLWVYGHGIVSRWMASCGWGLLKSPPSLRCLPSSILPQCWEK